MAKRMMVSSSQTRAITVMLFDITAYDDSGYSSPSAIYDSQDDSHAEKSTIRFGQRV